MSQLLAITSISLLGAMSPGPDFFVVIKNAGLYHWKNGVMAALGIAIALFIHQAYCISGLSWVLTASPTVFKAIKVLGGVYLFYLGISALRFKQTPELLAAENKVMHKFPTLLNSFKQGFLCNVLNPKAALFFIGLYALVIDPATSLSMKILYGLDIIIVTCIWFIGLTLIINIPKIKKIFLKFQTHFVRLFGGILVLFGLKVLFL